MVCHGIAVPPARRLSVSSRNACHDNVVLWIIASLINVVIYGTETHPAKAENLYK